MTETKSAKKEKIKEDSALRTIGEVAELLELSPHVLRFWGSKFPQVKPLKRRGSHRYYRSEDIELLRLIKNLLHAQSFTIKGAQKYLEQSAKGQLYDDQPDLFADFMPLKKLASQTHESPIIHTDTLPTALKSAGLSLQHRARLQDIQKELHEFTELLRQSQ